MQFIIFLVRNPVFWLLVFILIWGSQRYNTLIKQRAQAIEALTSLGNSMKLLKANAFMLYERLIQAGIAKELIDEVFSEKAGLERIGNVAEQGTLIADLSRQDLRIPSMNYPDWLDKSSEILNRSEQIFETKNKEWDHWNDSFATCVESAKDYNRLVSRYNAQLDSFPTGILAAMLNLQKLPLWT